MAATECFLSFVTSWLIGYVSRYTFHIGDFVVQITVHHLLLFTISKPLSALSINEKGPIINWPNIYWVLVLSRAQQWHCRGIPGKLKSLQAQHTHTSDLWASFLEKWKAIFLEHHQNSPSWSPRLSIHTQNADTGSCRQPLNLTFNTKLQPYQLGLARAKSAATFKR